MGLINRLTSRDVCTYWARMVDGKGRLVSGQFGEARYEAPVEVGCRWDDVESIVKTREGREVVSQAQVMISTDVRLEGVLIHKPLVEVEDVDNPLKNVGAFAIIKTENIDNIRRTETLHLAYL